MGARTTFAMCPDVIQGPSAMGTRNWYLESWRRIGHFPNGLQMAASIVPGTPQSHTASAQLLFQLFALVDVLRATVPGKNLS
jgi:hypothetical protein